jgi:predicted cation transporter
MITTALFVILVMILILPFLIRSIEVNIEYFLFVMGIIATLVSGVLSFKFFSHILMNHLMYLITGAVFLFGILFEFFKDKIKNIIALILKHISLKFFVFLLIVILGLISSLITAIIAALLLVEIVHVLPLKHKDKVAITVIACFSIGLGATLTPIGEPLSTIVVSILKADFFYLIRTIGIYIFSAIIILGIIGVFYIKTLEKNNSKKEKKYFKKENEEIKEIEKFQYIFVRSFKIFIFILALEFLGAGFKPLVETYIIHLDARFLYWINMISAVLDNATLASAEISPAMGVEQIKAILMGLLISGGMLIPGNIPNIISAGKLNIKSREWAAIGIPLSLILLLVYYTLIFIV